MKNENFNANLLNAKGFIDAIIKYSVFQLLLVISQRFGLVHFLIALYILI